MKPKTQFKINTIEELLNLYKKLNFCFSLKNEIEDFNNGARYINCDIDNNVYIGVMVPYHKIIQNPYK